MIDRKTLKKGTESNYSLFSHEQDVLTLITDIIAREEYLDNPLLEPLTFLCHNYQKIFRQFEILTRTADRQQKNLTNTNKQLESANHEIKEAQHEAELANAAKSSFLAHMSHELRTPLNGILGYAQILLLDKSLTSDQLRRVSVMKQSGEHLLTLINDILDLSKIEAGKVELRLGEVRLQSFIGQITDLLRLKAEEKGLQFECKQMTPLPEGVVGDSKRLHQIVINLLNNAVKYTPKGSVVWKIAYQNGLLKMAVEDTGFGISEQDLPKIFDAFQQVGDQNHAIEGTGLGLPITRKLIQLMDGTLAITSELGKGSCFQANLPLAAISTEIVEDTTLYAHVIGYRGRRLCVLVADDKDYNRDVLKDLLAPIGFEVIEARDGQETVDQVIRHKPDLLLLDLAMPVLDGYEAARRIRQQHTEPLSIIAISASVLEVYKQQGFEAGCDAFLPKPIELEVLFRAMSDVMGLEWITEVRENPEAVKPIDMKNIIAPPRDKIDELTHLVLSGDISGIIECGNELTNTDEAYRPFAKVVIQLAKSFQEKKLKTFIDHYQQ